MVIRLRKKLKEVYTLLTNLWTCSEIQIGVVTGILWGWLNYALGGIDSPIKALAILVCLDFATGVIAAFKRDELSSRIGAKGILKKVGIFVCVMFGFLLDTATGLNMFRGMVISGFAIIEGLSLIENIDRMGYGDMIPQFLRAKMAQIEEEKHLKEDDKDGNR